MNNRTICSVVDKKEKLNDLIYNILFGTTNVILIVFDDYCEFKDRNSFKDKVRTIICRGDVKIKDERIIHTEENVIWKLEIKRL